VSDGFKELVRQQYSRQAHLYARSQSHARGDSLELMAQWARDEETELVLDVACGCGFSSFALAPLAREVVAVDLTPAMLKEASRLARERGIANIRFLGADAESLPFPEGRFHLVACRLSAHHFYSPLRFLSESFRVLATMGSLLLIDTSVPEDPEVALWQNTTERLRDPSHRENLPPSRWKELIEEAGFHLVGFSTQHRTNLRFGDWVRTSGCPPRLVSDLLERFEQAPAAVKQAFQIRRDGSQIIFSWPLAAFKACKA